MNPMIKDEHKTVVHAGDTLYSHELRCEVKIIKDEGGGLAFDHELLSTGKTHRFKLEADRAARMVVVS